MDTIAPAIPIRPEPTPGISPFGRYCARRLAAVAYRCDKDTETLRRMFSGCEAAGYGMGGDFEWVALSELAALAVS